MEVLKLYFVSSSWIIAFKLLYYGYNSIINWNKVGMCGFIENTTITFKRKLSIWRANDEISVEAAHAHTCYGQVGKYIPLCYGWKGEGRAHLSMLLTSLVNSHFCTCLRMNDLWHKYEWFLLDICKVMGYCIVLYWFLLSFLKFKEGNSQVRPFSLASKLLLDNSITEIKTV